MPLELIDENDELLYAIAFDELERQRKEIEENPNQLNTARFWDNEDVLMAIAFALGMRVVIENGVRRSFSILNADGVLSTVQEIIASVDTERLMRDIDMVANNNAFKLVKGLNETTRQQLSEMFARSIEEGLSRAQIAEQLTPIFGEKRAKLIAITESTRAHAEGNAVAANELRNNGFVVEEIWITVMDSFVCVICEPLEGGVRGIDWFELPPDMTHPGCRCGVVNRIL